MNCEWKNILINSLKVNLQEDKITNRISSCNDIYYYRCIMNIKYKQIIQ